MTEKDKTKLVYFAAVALVMTYAMRHANAVQVWCMGFTYLTGALLLKGD